MDQIITRLITLCNEATFDCTTLQQSGCEDCKYKGKDKCFLHLQADYLVSKGVTVLNDNQIVVERCAKDFIGRTVYTTLPIGECDDCPKCDDGDCCLELRQVYDGTHPKYDEDTSYDFMLEKCPREVLSREYRESDYDKIGKTIFFTREEAEKILKEMEGTI